MANPARSPCLDNLTDGARSVSSVSFTAVILKDEKETITPDVENALPAYAQSSSLSHTSLPSDDKSRDAAAPDLPLPRTPSASTPPAHIRPTNFLTLSRSHQSISGSFVIDPRIKLSAAHLPPLGPGETEETRRNASFHSSTGSVKIDLFIVGDDTIERPVLLFCDSDYGSVHVKLVPDAARPRIHLNARSANRSLQVDFPRSFNGPLTVATQYGSFKLSAPLTSELTTVSEINGVRKYFVGDIPRSTDAEGWRGDEAHVETVYGSLSLRYENELPYPVPEAIGFFSKLW
ncbi:unnamed protein product [Mycena citricolor]|uniref:DUF7330 domain-containing protein n=1 Tax=Mycena citricolor TaxID=2018698 RepID=A0AAD2HV52_9AGAR|nr:unnamed protein product [Mycena citricolor]